MVRAGYKQTEVGEIPEDWLFKPLENFTSFISYGFTNPMPTVYDGIHMITARDINNGRIQLGTARRTSFDAYKTFLSPKSKPKKNDVLLTKDGTLGRLALVGDDKICINQSVAILRPNERIYPLFLKQLLESPPYQAKMLDDAGGSTIKHIYITIVNKMLLALPEASDEQKAIAKALSDVDELLASLEKLIAKKRDIKTATMQQLLTGKKRLAGFGEGKGYKQTELGKIPEDWEVKPIGGLLKIRHGKSQKEVVDPNGEFPILATGGELGRAREPLYSKPSVLIGRKGTIDIPYYMDTPFWTVDTLFYSEVSKNADAKFLYYKFLFIDWYQYNEASGVPSLNAATIEKIIQSVPKTKEEQTAISGLLTDFDTEVESLQLKLDKTKSIKQGMMQELLTGRIRLI